MTNSRILAASLLALCLVACDETKKPDAKAQETESPEATKTEKTEKAPKTGEAPKAATASVVSVDPGEATPKEVTRAVAMLYPTKDSKTAGKVTFEKTADGLKVVSEFTGLPKGKHAHHIHLLGDCSGADGKTAGTHFNLEGSSKNPPKDIKRITGDLGDLEAGDDGNAKGETVLKTASLQGAYSILGRSIIIHEKANNHDHPPIGAAGGRLACGVIGLTE